jgi:hypothetical protein
MTRRPRASEPGAVALGPTLCTKSHGTIPLGQCRIHEHSGDKKTGASR